MRALESMKYGPVGKREVPFTHLFIEISFVVVLSREILLSL